MKKIYETETFVYESENEYLSHRHKKIGTGWSISNVTKGNKTSYAVTYIRDIKHNEENPKTCCICGKKIIGFGNNPYPLSDREGDRCCDECNRLVVWQRIVNLRNIDKEKENAKRGY